LNTARLGEEGKAFFPHFIWNEGFRVVADAHKARDYIISRQEDSKMPEHLRRFNQGFSLIELLVVVAVILVIAAIAIPNFMKSKIRANESSAVHSLRMISTAEVFYKKFSTA
jgi:prepilin-type N-terminal cleavage/methylation domain-containing protein